MNSLLLIVLVSCPPGGDPGYQPAPAAVAASPDAGPSQHGHPRLFGWLRGHRHHGKCACAGKGRADDGGAPVAAAPATQPAIVMEAVPPEPAIVMEAVPPEPAPPVVATPAPAAPAPRLVPRPQPVTTSAEPPPAAPSDAAPRQMPRGPAVMTSAEPPRD